MKVSIITPLYNTRQYIEKCIRSLYKDNVIPRADFEFIVINDGSTDGGEKIVEELQKEYDNLFLINKENGGQSTARNLGFKKAKGKYIFCLDSDDWINAVEFSNALEYALENDLDMLPIYFSRYNKDLEEIKSNSDNYPLQKSIISGGEFLHRFTVSGTMWRYFYKRSIVEYHNLFLLEGVFHEDEDYVVKFMSFTNRISYVRHNVYNYVIHENSTINKKIKSHRLRLLNDILKVIASLNLHRKNFDDISLEYKGISKKIEQLSISMFLRMKREELNYNDVLKLVDSMKILGVYPLKINESNIKFRIISKFLNRKLFVKYLFMKH